MLFHSGRSGSNVLVFKINVVLSSTISVFTNDDIGDGCVLVDKVTS